MFNPKTSYAKIAYDTILFFVSTGQIRKTSEDKISTDLKLNRACIVSIFDLNDNLLRSYGDINPKNNFLYDEIIENAIGAASKYENLEPIISSQLNQIKVCVDVLSVPHVADNLKELNPQKHGLFIRDRSGKSGFIMPNIKGVNTVEEQIEKLKNNTGISEKDNSKLDILFFKLTRYD
ncbi:MAG: AMMECR1 domain-containing protein [Bacteroidales bacterium]|nr:AMMECR1 domain-containing protein [Bacteroidales bacterium]